MRRICVISLICVAVAACVPTTSGEFDTDGRPTTNSSEKLALITGVDDGSIPSIRYAPRPKQYTIMYFADRISPQRLAAARERMCRYRNVTFDRVDRDEKPVINNAPADMLRKTKNLRLQYFYCR